jgi:hypothetical protein
MGGWPTAGEGLVTVAIPVVGVLFTFTANRRAQYDRVLALVAESGTPPIRTIGTPSAWRSSQCPSCARVNPWN